MANQTTGPVWVIDTQSATVITAPGGAKITEVAWVGATAVSHTATLKDRNGAIIFYSCAPTVAAIDRAYPNVPCTGIVPSQIDSGRLLITWG